VHPLRPAHTTIDQGKQGWCLCQLGIRSVLLLVDEASKQQVVNMATSQGTKLRQWLN